MIKLTFKQYLESKEQLRKAIENTPTAIVEYEIKKYCSIALGESEDDKQLVGLKPKHKIIVEWRYDNIENPSPTSVKVVGSSEVDSTEKHSTYWSGIKLKKWLTRHATEGQNHGVKL